MVTILKKELIDNLGLIATLKEVSDNMCQDEERKCIDFDKFPSFCLEECRVSQNQPATVDALILNFSEKHILFVEFKDLKTVAQAKEWLTKVKLQQVFLKIHESFHMLSKYIVTKALASYDEFYSYKKSVLIVYDVKDTKRVFHKHFKGKVNRFRYLVEKELVINCKQFINFIERENLC